MICSSWYGTCALLKLWLDSGGATADSDGSAVLLRDPSKHTLYNSIGLSLTNSICTLAFGIVLASVYSGSSPAVTATIMFALSHHISHQ